MELAHHDLISTSVYNFYKQCRLSKYVAMKEERNVENTIDEETEAMEEAKTPVMDFKSGRSSSIEQAPAESSSSEESLEEDEDYQILRDANNTRRKRSRSTPAPPTDYPSMPVGSLEAPAILGSNPRGARLCEFCNTGDTPMWRRGPSGKGTLCNACGVKWSLSNRKRNTKRDSGSHHIVGQSTSRKVSPERNHGEQKSTGKARKTQRPNRADGRSRDDDLSDSSEEEYKEEVATTEGKEYYCGYCNTSWPQGHFKNIQQFGAHCSNCSRKHPKESHNNSSEETGQKRKFEEEKIEKTEELPGDLVSLITAVEDQILAEEAAKKSVDRSGGIQA